MPTFSHQPAMLSPRDDWNAAMRKTRDEPDSTILIVDASALCKAVKGYSALNKRALSEHANRAVWAGIVGRAFIRYTSNTAHCMLLSGGNVYYDSAGGYGYDRVAAAFSGMPIHRKDGSVWTVLCDHSQGDQVQIHRSGSVGLLNAGLFTIGG